VPQGIPLLSDNVMEPHGILYSRECGFVGEADIHGIRDEIYYHKSIDYAVLLAIVGALFLASAFSIGPEPLYGSSPP